MNQIPESEKLRIVEELLRNPRSPIRPEASQSLTREQKLSLFDKLVQEGVITSTSLQVEIPSSQNEPKQYSRKELLEAIARAGGPEKLSLHRITLSGSDFERINLHGADLCGTNLSSINFAGADLSNTKLSGVSLRQANLQGANLSGADLSSGKHATPDGREIEIGAADLERADLRWADLERACLLGVNFKFAKLEQANLTGAEIGRKPGAEKWQVTDLEYTGVTWQQLRTARLKAGIIFPGGYYGFKSDFHNCARRHYNRGEYERVLELTELFLGLWELPWDTPISCVVSVRRLHGLSGLARCAGRGCPDF